MGKASSSPPLSAAPLWEATSRRQSVERHVGGNYTTYIIGADNILLKQIRAEACRVSKGNSNGSTQSGNFWEHAEPTREGMKMLNGFRIVRHTFLATYRARFPQHVVSDVLFCPLEVAPGGIFF